MVIGIGVDIVQVCRVEPWLENQKMLERFFNQAEIQYVQSLKAEKAQSLAARFAAKEALGKALGTGLKNIELKKLCVKNDSNGAPYFELEQDLLNPQLKRFSKSTKDVRIHLSLSHEKDYAVAMVIIETE